MCGIIAYNGTKKVDSVLLNALKAMEYRGYDSAGVAVFGGGNPVLHRALGEVNNLSEQVLQESFTSGVGIGHTRWATHGGVSLDNTHPHYSQDESVYLVHNGIIENFTEIKSFLEKEGVSFYGQTDTEILANLVAYHLKKEDSLVSALKKTLKEARGAYGLAVVEVANPNEIVVAKNGSPIILGVADHGLILASDVNAIIPYTRDILYMQDGEMAILRENNDYQILNFQGDAKDRPLEHVDHDIGMVEKGDFEYFMLKEIYEQPAVIYNTARGRINYDTGEVKLGGLEWVLPELLKKKKMVILACGTSYYAGLVAKNFLQEIADLEVSVEIASEYRYQKNFYSDDMVVLAISQSGETADTIAALKEVQKKGIMTLGVVNVPGSSIANMTDAGVYTHAGSEIGVASTKAFTAQMSALFMISLLIGDHKNLSVIDKRQYIEAFGKLRDQIQEVLDNEDAIKRLAAELKNYDHTFFLGRYYQVPIAYEASLKFKEITYIHSEAYPAGELKHGPLALIDPQHPSVLFAPEDGMFDKTISVYQEVSARGGKVYTVSNVEGSDIVIPKTHPILYPFLTVIVSQLLAYHTAKLLGREIDKPRNLAKSVTVE